MPIYFCYENEEIISVVDSLREEWEQTGSNGSSDGQETTEVRR